MNRTNTTRRARWVLLLLAFGCGDDDAATDAAVDASTIDAPALDAPGIDAPGTDAATLDSSTASGWELRAHPCSGNRTDTLWVDDDATAFVGCGSTTTGDQGFYVSTDEGRTWAEPVTTPNAFFDTWRVHDISRSADGLLYVAGRNTANAQRVVRVDTSASPWSVELVFEAGSTVAFSFEVGGFRRSASGRSIAESSTGTGIIYRDADADEWLDGSDWDEAFGGLQILQLDEHAGGFYGAGSTISEPPKLYVPSGDAFGFEVIELSTGIGMFDGEMWGLDVDDGGIVVVGVDQNRDVGMVYTTALDGTLENTLDVSTLYPDDATWMRGACRRGALVVAVGEQSRSGRGIVLRSDDGGGTWMDVTPEPEPGASFPSVHRCAVLDDGGLYVTGANGVFAVARST